MNEQKNGLISIILIVVIIGLIGYLGINFDKIFNIKKTPTNVPESNELSKFKNFDSSKISSVEVCGSYADESGITMECNTLENKDANALLNELDKMVFTKSINREEIFTTPGTVNITYNDETTIQIIVSFDGVLYVTWDLSEGKWREYQLSNLNFLNDYTELYIK